MARRGPVMVVLALVGMLLAVVGAAVGWVGYVAWQRGMLRSYPAPMDVNIAAAFHALLHEGGAAAASNGTRQELIDLVAGLDELERAEAGSWAQRYPGVEAAAGFRVHLWPRSWLTIPEGGMEGRDPEAIAAAWFSAGDAPTEPTIDGLSMAEAAWVAAYEAVGRVTDAYAGSAWPARAAELFAGGGVSPFPPAGSGTLAERSESHAEITRACRRVCAAEMARFERAVELGAFGEAEEAFANVVRVARAEAVDPRLGPQLTSSGHMDTLRASLLPALDRLPAGSLRAMLEEFRAIERGWPDWRRSIEGERLQWIEQIERFYTRGEPVEFSSEPSWLERAMSSRAAERHFAELVIESMRRWSREPWVTVAASPDQATPDEVLVSAPGGCLLLREWGRSPWLDRAIQGLLRAELERRGMLVRLALETHRAERGAYPVSLEELVPAYLDALPIDTQHPAGAPLSYIRGAPEDSDARGGRPCLVYSVGWDGEDDGGESARRSETDGRWRPDLDIPLTGR